MPERKGSVLTSSRFFKNVPPRRARLPKVSKMRTPYTSKHGHRGRSIRNVLEPSVQHGGHQLNVAGLAEVTLNQLSSLVALGAFRVLKAPAAHGPPTGGTAAERSHGRREFCGCHARPDPHRGRSVYYPRLRGYRWETQPGRGPFLPRWVFSIFHLLLSRIGLDQKPLTRSS